MSGPAPETALDRPGSVREGEELDLEALARHLGRHLPELTGGGPVEAAQFKSGYSNLTYLLRFPATGREAVLRRPPFGSEVATAHDMGREHRVLSGLARVGYRAPRPLFHEPDPEVLGAPFYLMQRVEGVVLRRDPPPGVGLDPETARRLGLAFVDVLAELHGLDLEAAGLEGFGRPAGYTRRQVEGWSERWRAAATDPEPPEMEEVARWLDGRVPAETGATLVHNDFKYDNLVLDPEDPARVRAILDWEMATVGDPLMDLGTSLGYWVEADDPEPLLALRFGPTHLPGSPGRREIARRYAEVTGRPTGDLAFYYAFGLFKIAVIAQQIYYRYRRGLTRDERFAALPAAVAALAATAAGVAERERL